MTEMVRQEITAPAAWIGPEIEKETHWYYHLDDKAIAELDAALQTVKASGRTIRVPPEVVAPFLSTAHPEKRP